MKIELNEDFKNALKLLENGENIFLTGKAGTGKSTFLKYFIEHSNKNMVVLAPTGVAALNVGGQTVHSFFSIFPHEDMSDIEKIISRQTKTKKNLYKSLDLIVIDEVSLLRADLLDLINEVLKTTLNTQKPFGGKQILFVGDLYQLPPVVTSREKEIFSMFYDSPYFFSARCYPQLNVKIVEFEKIYRQKDENFIEILNKIRNGEVSQSDIDFLNQRLISNAKIDNDVMPVYLTPYNEMARKINEEKLSELKGKKYEFPGKITGNFNVEELPTDEILVLKKNAQVMLLTNSKDGLWVNGTIGRVESFEDETIKVLTEDNNIVYVEPFEWDVYEYRFDEKEKAIKKKKIGSFIQYPLKLSWAITIHKSQGKTFNHVVLDVGKGAFSPGQIYVALSRCTSLEGLFLVKPLKKSHIFIDRKIIKFMTQARWTESEKKLPLKQKISIIEQAINNGQNLEITYLKKQDEKSRRKVIPISVGEMDYNGKKFLGLKAFCNLRKEERVFRVDRILEIKIVN